MNISNQEPPSAGQGAAAGGSAQPMPSAAPLIPQRMTLTHSIGWTAIAQSLGLVISVAGGMITARLLLPQDYAVMAMVAPLIGVAQIMQTLGLAAAIINAKTMTKQQVDLVFWCTMTGAVILGSLVAAGGPILAHWLTGRDFGR